MFQYMLVFGVFYSVSSFTSKWNATDQGVGPVAIKDDVMENALQNTIHGEPQGVGSNESATAKQKVSARRNNDGE